MTTQGTLGGTGRDGHLSRALGFQLWGWHSSLGMGHGGGIGRVGPLCEGTRTRQELKVSVGTLGEDVARAGGGIGGW